MKKCKRIFGSAAFLAIGLILTILTSYLMRPTHFDFGRARFSGFYAEEKNSLDVVGLGSSALYRYLNAPALYEETGFTSYALATPQQPVSVTERMIDEILKTQSPQLLIVESRTFLHAEEDEVDGHLLHFVTDNLNYSLNRVSMINELIDDWSERLSFYFDIMLYHQNWENLGEEAFSYLLNRKENPMKGWVDNDKHRFIKKPQLTTEELPLSEASEDALRGIMEKCREENLNVLFVLSPFRESQKSQERANYMRRIVEEQGFHFLDCNLCVDDMGIDFSTDFYNKSHVNSIGADKFSRYLGRYIAENYEIDASHSPEVTASWKKAAEENHARYEKVRRKILRKVQKKKEKANANAQPQE